MRLEMNNLSTRLPIIAICGATGTGKSKLAIDLASKLDGQVINADAVQLYSGLDIATNKVTPEETKGVLHHLLGCLNPVEGFYYNVHRYRHDCCSLIEQMRSRGVLPLVVGGTHYYLEAVLWKDFLRPTSGNGIQEPGFHSPDFARECRESRFSWPEDLLARLPKDPADYYSVLRNLEPEVAKHLHPKDIRKLQQALLVHFSRQVSKADDMESPSPPIRGSRGSLPRYPPPESLILWLDCESSVLKSRLDERVDKMVQRGLVEELDNFLVTAANSLLPADVVATENGVVTEEAKRAVFQLANKGSLPSVGTEHWCRGILQSIGFKEFEAFLQLSLTDRHSAAGQAILNDAVENMKTATRQYAKRQVSWIRNRFLKRPELGGIPVYRLDVTPVLSTESSEESEALWSSRILGPCLSMLRGDTTMSRLVPEKFIDASPSEVTSDLPPPPYACSACGGRVFVDPTQWLEHTRSRSHKKRVARLKGMNSGLRK